MQPAPSTGSVGQPNRVRASVIFGIGTCIVSVHSFSAIPGQLLYLTVFVAGLIADMTMA